MPCSASASTTLRPRHRLVAASSPTVLVVEDETAQLEILTYNLEAEGFRFVPPPAYV